MKRIRRILAILLCLALCLTACGAPDTASVPADSQPAAPAPAQAQPDDSPLDNIVATGKYVETDITPPLANGQTLSKMGTWPDGTLYCFAMSDTLDFFTSTDCGATWQQRTVLRFDDVHPGDSARTQLFTAAPDGSVCYAFELPDGDSTTPHLYRAAPDGTGAELAVDALQEHSELGEAMWFYALNMSGDGMLLLRALVFPAGQEGFDTGTYKIFVIDPETGSCAREIALAGGPADACGQNGYYEFGYDKQVVYYDYETGIGRTLGLLDTGVGDDITKQVGVKLAVLDEEANTLAALSEEDLRIVTPGGALTEILCSSGYTFSDPRNTIRQLAAMPDGSFYARYSSGSDGKLCRYVFDSDAPILAASGTMTVWALNSSDVLRAAVAEFQSRHPEIEVVLEFGHTSTMDDGILNSDIITGLNTRLIAGDAPDVLILDGLPARGYIQKGALLDLTGLVEESGYFSNILNAWKTDGGTWAYPAFARLCVLVSDPALGLAPASLAELAEAAVQGPDAPAPGYDPLPLEQQPLLYTKWCSDLIDLFYPDSSAKIFPNGERLDEDALREFYTALADIGQKHGLIGSDWGTVTAVDSSVSLTIHDMRVEVWENRSRATAGILYGFGSVSSEISRRGFEPQLMPNGTYLPGLSAAVPAKAAQPELAREFIRDILLGEESQTHPGINGLPVSRSGLAAAQQEYTALVRQRIEKQPEQYDEEPYMEEALALDYAALMEQAATRGEQNVLLRSIVEESARAILSGELSVDAAVEKTAADVRLYFAEQG